MNKIYCRIYQFIMRIGMNFLPWRKPEMIVGSDSTAKIPEILKNNKVNNVLIVTDAGIVSHNLHLPTIEALTKSKLNFTLYDKTVPNPTIDNIEEALNLYNKNGCNGIIAIGGGSPMDCAKGVGARVVNPKKSITKMRGLLHVKHKIPTLIAIPTTAGTGSETTLAAVITDSKTHEKYAINDPHLIPHYAILDPQYTKSLPAGLTATTGLDALTHAVEAYIGNSNTKETKKCAEKSVRLIFDNLSLAVKNGMDLKARENMQMAAFWAGVAFTRAYVGNVHSIAHTLGGQYGVPHGLANAIILPKVLKYYGSTIYKKIYKLCQNSGILLNYNTPKERTKKFIEELESLNKVFNINTCIPQLKISDIESLSRRAEKESNPLYPVPVIFTLKDFSSIYNQLLCKSNSN